MKDSTAVNKKLNNAHLICLALWGVLTVWATAALTSAVSVPTHTANTDSVNIATE